MSGPRIPITLSLLSLRRRCRLQCWLWDKSPDIHYKQVTGSSDFTTRDGPDARRGTEFLAWGQAAPPSRIGCLGTDPS